MFGTKHQELVDWLSVKWWMGGPPISLISGFPGTGKTEVALQAIDVLKRDHPELPVAHFNCVECQSGQPDDLLIKLSEELAAVGDSELIRHIERGDDIQSSFARILAPPRLIVADEAQLLLAGSTGTLPQPIASFFERWSQIGGAAGRLLLLSNREFEPARWNSRIEVRRLESLEIDQALKFLDSLLEATGRSDAVPAARREDIVSWLGRNPRAIQLFSRELERHTLDELIGLAPEAWEARYREVSPNLLRQFEEAILERAERGLGTPAQLFLRRLSVVRQPVNTKMLEALQPEGDSVQRLRDELIDRYMLHLRRNYYEIHPVLRATVRRKMTGAERRRAHLAAGRHYAAPFRAQRALGAAERLGARFIEARYHFTLAESEADLDDISRRFEAHYRSRFGLVTPVPTDPNELDERITLLSSLLQARGAKGLEFHLAKCLLARNRPGDSGRALPHARRATGPQSPEQAWLLRMRLEAREFGAAASVSIAREALALLPNEQKTSIYLMAAQLLVQEGKEPEALTLLRRGMKELSSEASVSQLYQTVGELLARQGRPEEGLEVLRKGMEIVRPEYSLFSLYESAGEVLKSQGKADAALTILFQGLEQLEDSHSVGVLSRAIAKVVVQAHPPLTPQRYLQRAIEATDRTLNRNRLNLLSPRILGLVERIAAAETPGAKPVDVQPQPPVAALPDPTASVEQVVREPVEYIVTAPAHHAFDASRAVLAMRPDRWFGLYVLGCYDRIKSVFVQQCRALTLVHGLFETGELTQGSRLAVVGGGAAGVTAAAAAASKGAKVILFEQATSLLHLQRQNTSRFLHPHILNWPTTGSTKTTAGLPLLDWHAAHSNEVAQQIESGFDEIRRKTGNIELRVSTTVDDIAQLASADSGNRIQIVAAEGSITEAVDVAIIAIGFGVEAPSRWGVATPPYWQNDGLDQAFLASPDSPRRVLVSGSGDGALIDIMRASVAGFRHDMLADLLPTGAELAAVEEALVRIELVERKRTSLRGWTRTNLHAEYEKISLSDEYLQRIRDSVRTDTQVWFNATAPGYFKLDSSLLNRFLVSLLVRTGRVKPKLARLDGSSLRMDDSGRYSVLWPRAQREEKFDTVVLRHGPPQDYVSEVFPPLTVACAPLRGKMRELGLVESLEPATKAFFAI